MRKFRVVVSDSERVVVDVVSNYMTVEGPILLFSDDISFERIHAAFMKFDYAYEEVANDTHNA